MHVAALQLFSILSTFEYINFMPLLFKDKACPRSGGVDLELAPFQACCSRLCSDVAHLLMKEKYDRQIIYLLNMAVEQRSALICQSMKFDVKTVCRGLQSVRMNNPLKCVE